jgi:hypothetical protein
MPPTPRTPTPRPHRRPRRPARPRLATTRPHTHPTHATATLHSPTLATPVPCSYFSPFGMPSPAGAIPPLSHPPHHRGVALTHALTCTPTGLTCRMTHTWQVHQLLLPNLSGETDCLPVANLHAITFATPSHHVDRSGLCDSCFSLAIL